MGNTLTGAEVSALTRKTAREGLVKAARELLQEAKGAEPYFVVGESTKMATDSTNAAGYVFAMKQLRRAAEKFIQWHAMAPVL